MPGGDHRTADRQQNGCRVGRHGHDVDRLLTAEHLRRAGGIRHLEGNGVRAALARRGRPGKDLLSVDSVRAERGAGGQAERGPRQRILVEIRGMQRELQRLAENRHLVADRQDLRRGVGVRDRKHEALRIGEDRVLAQPVPAVRRRHGDREVAPVGHARRELDLPRAVAVVDETGERRQPARGQRQRVAAWIGGIVRVGGLYRQREHRVVVHRPIRDRGDDRRLVHLQHGDRHGRGRAQRLAGARAVLAGRESHRITARVAVIRIPNEHARVRVERGTWRQPAHRIRHRGIGSFQRGQGAVG